MFGKIITAMVTPFNDKDNIDFSGLKQLINHLIKNKTSSILVSGTTGESPTLTDIEKTLLYSKTIEYVNKRVPIIANVGSNSTRKTIDFIKKIDYLNLDAYLVVVPYYNKPPQEGLYQHFKQIANSTKKPILIYNVPSRTGVDIELETIVKLSEIDNIIGLKEATGQIDKIVTLSKIKPDFLVYTGDDIHLYEAMTNGAEGVISVASHIYGDSIHSIIQLILTNQLDDAKALFDIYRPKFSALFSQTNPIPVKAALNRLQLNVGDVRLPLVDMTHDEKCELFKKLGI